MFYGDCIGHPAGPARQQPHEIRCKVPVREISVIIDTGKLLRIVTNDLDAPGRRNRRPLQNKRWQIELFFSLGQADASKSSTFGRRSPKNAVPYSRSPSALIAFLILRMAQLTQKSGA